VTETKYIFVTGGVVSSLGKGIISSSIGKLLQARGYNITIQKFDPYINIDPGTLNPYEHGECYVTADGMETDLDLGHYERFTGIQTTKANSMTTGRIYKAVIDKDFASQRLAELVEADLFIVLTGVDYVFVNYNKPDQAKLEHVNVAQLEEYIKQDQFAPGSMLPKVEAAIAFVNGRPEGKAVITSLENLGALIESESGTIIQKD